MRAFLLASILVLTAGTAHADVTRDALADIVKCADIADAAKRLECFDAAAARGKTALAAPVAHGASGQGEELVGLVRLFEAGAGDQARGFRQAGAGEPGPSEVNQVSGNVLEFAKTARGKAVFILENGMVWRQLDSDSTEVLPPPPGTTMKVTVETGASWELQPHDRGKEDPREGHPAQVTPFAARCAPCHRR